MSAATLRPAERHQFLLDYIGRASTWLDVLDADFVTAYIEATGAPHHPQPFGAPSCRMLGRDLAALYRKGLLSRCTVGVPGGGDDFPNWVYSYTAIT